MDATTHRYSLLLTALEASAILSLKRLHSHASNIHAFNHAATRKITQAQIQAQSLGSQAGIAQLNDVAPDDRDVTRGRTPTLQSVQLKHANTLEIALAGAIFVARAAIVGAYRTTIISTYASNEADGWEWEIEGPDPCQFCLSMEGTIHPLSEEFESHPNCYCQPIPWFAQ